MLWYTNNDTQHTRVSVSVSVKVSVKVSVRVSVYMSFRAVARKERALTVICIAVCTIGLAKLRLQLCILSGNCQILTDLLRIG